MCSFNDPLDPLVTPQRGAVPRVENHSFTTSE